MEMYVASSRVIFPERRKNAAALGFCISPRVLSLRLTSILAEAPSYGELTVSARLPPLQDKAAEAQSG